MKGLQWVFAGRWAPVLALVAGGVLPLAFAPFHWWIFALISPAILFAIGTAAPERTALRAGYLFGLGFYGVGVSWVYVSIGRYGHSGPVLAVLFTALFVALLALFPWLCVKVARRLRPEGGVLAVVLVFPVIWLLLEWVRTWLLTGFPWLLVGYSQTDGPLAPFAPVVGVLGLSAVLVLFAGVLAWFMLRPSMRRGLSILVLVSVFLSGTRLLDNDWTDVAGDPLSVALIQGNIAQDQKWSPEFFEITLDRYRELTEQHWGVDLVVWPEAAVPNWYHRVAEDYLLPLAEAGRSHGTELVLGVPFVDLESAKAYNSIVSLGAEPGVYHKRHLVPFGEYLPLRSVFGSALDLLGAPMSDFDAGVASEPLYAAGHPIGATVCYEVAFGPELAAALPASHLLINVSNDAWFGDSLAPHQHLQMARMRSMETGRDMLRATNTGITAVIDHKGRIVARAPQFEVATLVGQAIPRSGATPYVRWYDYPLLSVMFLVLVGLVASRLVARRKDQRSIQTSTESDCGRAP